MDLRHLRYFVAVAEEQNVTRAALRLHVSQPPLSRQMRNLEEELGIALFHRGAKAMRLTEAGRVFLTEARMILKRAEGGCVFLQGNLCSVYEARPQNCANFPHVVRGTGSIASRMWQFLDRVGYCPIVYNWMEKVKEDIGFP